MRASIISFITIACFAFIGCRTVVVDCVNVVVGLQFEGFDGEEIDTVLVRHYAPGGGFTTLLRTDTLSFMRRSPVVINQDGLRAGQDYAVEVPATGKRVTIGNITMAGRETERIRESIWTREEHLCVNRVVSFEQDGVLVNGQSHEATAIVVR